MEGMSIKTPTVQHRRRNLTHISTSFGTLVQPLALQPIPPPSPYHSSLATKQPLTRQRKHLLKEHSNPHQTPTSYHILAPSKIDINATVTTTMAKKHRLLISHESYTWTHHHHQHGFHLPKLVLTSVHTVAMPRGLFTQFKRPISRMARKRYKMVVPGRLPHLLPRYHDRLL